MSERIWFCKIGGPAAHLPRGSDLPMRRAVERAFEEVTGSERAFTFSGWGGSLTEGERAVIENRQPVPPTLPAPAIDVEEVIDALMRVAPYKSSYETGASGLVYRAEVEQVIRAVFTKNTDAQR